LLRRFVSRALNALLPQSDPIGRVASELRLPRWWVESIALEYLDCRRFVDSTPPYVIEFGHLTANRLRDAVKTHKIVVRDQVIHNVRPDVFRIRALWRVFSALPRPLAAAEDDVFANGVVSPHSFHWHPNSLQDDDSKLWLSRTFQVLDEGVLYQWRFAQFEVVPGRHYGKWTSDVVNLEAFDALEVRRRQIFDHRQDFKSSAAFQAAVEEFFADIERERELLLGALLELHNRWKVDRPNRTRVAAAPPPKLSTFETFTVRDGTFYSNSAMAPLFFRACCSHVAAAKGGTAAGDDVSSLSDAYQDRAAAIILGSACLESYVNEVGDAVLGALWETHYERSLDLGTKISIIGLVRGDTGLYDLSRAPFQNIGSLINKRNYLLHHKPTFERSRPAPGRDETITSLAAVLDGRFVERLPNALVAAVTTLSTVAGQSPPAWLISGPGWTLP
jgi:hypothetical protein